MPKAIIGIIILGTTVGIWLNTKPSSPATGTVKGIALERDKTPLPNLAPLPTRKEGARDPKIDARQVAIIDVESGHLLFEKNGSEVVPVASLTKIMTALIVLESYDSKEVVEISKQAVTASGSTILLQLGEKITVENLLYGLLMNSGNDAALALAQYKSSVDEFVARMNRKAEELGLNGTEFKDPSGLDDAGVSNARDIAVLMAYALRHRQFREIIGTDAKDIASVDGKIIHKLESSNRLVKEEMLYPGIIGGKTGFTPTAGHNLVAAASRDNHTVVVTIINTHSPAKEASAAQGRKGLDWAFSNHVWLTTDQETNN